MSHSAADVLKERLRGQLVYFEEKSQEILNGFERIAERAVIKELMARYCREAERLVRGTGSESPDRLVWIGSKVTVCHEDDQTEECFTVVLPEEVAPDEGKISFLSPIGQKLLLCREGSKSEIDSPAGKYWITVKSVIC